VSDESIRGHLRAALDAIVVRESARLREAVGGVDVRVAGRIRAMRPLVESLRMLSEETGSVGGLRIDAPAEGERAWIEMVETAGSRHTLSISTDAENRRFEVEECQYFPLSGDRASYMHCFDTAEEVLRFVLEMLGLHIASRQALAGKPA